MQKLAIGLLGIMAGVALAIGFAVLPATMNTASAATASTGAFANSNFAAATGTASTSGFSGSAAGNPAVCPDFIAIGSCSESTS